MTGEQIRGARKRKGMSQTDLALAIGMTNGQSYISAIERNEANVTRETLDRIAAALGLEVQVRLVVPQLTEQPDADAPAVAPVAGAA